MLDERDLQAIGELMDRKLQPIQQDIQDLKESVEEIRGGTNLGGDQDYAQMLSMSNDVKTGLHKEKGSYRKKAKRLILVVAAVFTHNKNRHPQSDRRHRTAAV